MSTKRSHESESAKYRQANARECEERQHEASDLAAQWTAAVAAKNAAEIAISLRPWAVLEFIVSLTVLGAAVWAVLEAREAARQAKRAANAANDTLEHVRTISAQELRAYVLPTGGTFETVGEDKLQVMIKLKNSGQTPASDVVVSLSVKTFDGSLKHVQLPKATVLRAKMCLAPGAKSEAYGDMSLTTDQFQMFKDNTFKDHVYGWGRIDYVDAFKESRWANFIYRIGDRHKDAFGRDIMKWSVVPGDQGNDAN